MPTNRKKVALLIETSNAYARGLLTGINRFQQQMGNWLVFLPEQERGATPPEWLSRWNCDGLIARIENESIANFVREYEVPTVDVSAARLIGSLPWVETDDEQIGRLAVEHLVRKGFQNFAFCHIPVFNWSGWRCESFQSAVNQNGFSCSIYESLSPYDPGYSWATEFDRLSAWVQSLPKPVGVMACYDIKARQVLDACTELGIAVPEQVAVIGVDNDPLICEACNPPLTSISLDAETAGYEAAMILQDMMSGKTMESLTVRIAPIEIQERQSTDTVAVEDADVAAALQFIRENATSNIRVSDVLKQVDVSRRKLESRFKKLVGRTPHEEIQHRRFERVKNLLHFPDLSVSKIASLTGFDHPEYLSVAFQRGTGQTISQYREQLRDHKINQILDV